MGVIHTLEIAISSKTIAIVSHCKLAVANTYAIFQDHVLYPIDRIYLRFELQLMHTSKTTDRFSIELTKQGHYTHNISVNTHN